MNAKISKRAGSFHLTQKAEYALLLLINLSQNREKAKSIKDISREEQLSYTFLQKIAQELQKGNLIESIRGKQGGYKILKESKEISLREVLESVNEDVGITPCTFEKENQKICEKSKNCKIQKGILQINADLNTYLQNKTLAELMN